MARFHAAESTSDFNNLLDELDSFDCSKAETWLLKGLILKRLSASEECNTPVLDSYYHAYSIDPSRWDIPFNIANSLKVTDPASAVSWYLKSLKLNPFSDSCWKNLGLLYLEKDQPLLAIHSLSSGLKIKPDDVDALCNLGLSYLCLDRFANAEKCFKLAILCDNTDSKGHLNYGNLLMANGNLTAALDHLSFQSSLSSESADARFNLGLCHLMMGKYSDGWPLYESRFNTGLVDLPNCFNPLNRIYTFNELRNLPPNSRIVVWSEQGIGDTIQFVRYLNLLDVVGIEYDFYCEPSLVSLVRDWMLPGKSVISKSNLDLNGSYSHHIPLMSLPLLFDTNSFTIPCSLPYFKPSTQIPQHLQINDPPGGLSVGLVWATNPNNKPLYRHKSINLDILMPTLIQLIDMDLIDLHSLQVGSDKNQINSYLHNPRIFDWSDSINSFEDTAFLLNQLDLIISVDTAVAHLASALNRPTWLLLPKHSDFRWLRGVDDSPWYPGCMRLFRQQEQGDWSSVASQLHQAWSELLMLNLSAALPG